MSDRKNYMKEWRRKNKTRLREYNREYFKKNPKWKEYLKNYNKKYYLMNKSKLDLRMKQYRKENKEKLKLYFKDYKNKNRIKINNRVKLYRKNRRKKDISYKLKDSLSARIRIALKGIGKKDTTKDLVGCSIQELRQHLQSQFKEGMYWDNYGEWQIDHIRPCATFNLELEKEQKICFHYTNLQPLWAYENLSKREMDKLKIASQEE